MRPVLAAAALAALAMGLLAACTDDDPFRIADGQSAAFSVHPQLNRFGASELLPIDRIRLTVVSLPDSAEVMAPVEVPVAPDDPTWNLHLDVPLDGGPIDVLVFVELINDSAGSVEWSGVAGPFSLAPGGSAQSPTVDMFRGSLANLAITGVAIAGADTTTEGATLVLRASATGVASPQLFWSSLDPTIIELTGAALDSASFLPLAPGLARIVVEAGPRADTLEVQVQARVTALALTQAADTLTALLATATFGVAALDARGDTVSGVVFAWASSDSTIARSLGNGVFEALAPGTITVTATTPRAPTLSVDAQLTVRQDVDTVVAAVAADTVAAGQSLALSATARDANAQPIAGAALAWSSDDTTIVAIDSTRAGSAFVRGRAAGTTTLRSSLAGKTAATAVTVVPGADASVTIAPPTLSFASLNASACLSASASDAQGNATGSAVAWTARNAAIATVDGAGCVTAVANGDAYVVATAGGVSDSANVQVAQVADSVDVALADAQVAAGAGTTASGAAFDAGGSAIAGAAFTWSSSDETVATVAADGSVTAVDVGSAWIRGAHGALADSALLTVVAGQAASVTLVSGDAQSGTVATQLPDSLVVLVSDALGNPVQGAIVAFTTASGSLAPAAPTTDALGRAVAYWTLGTAAGPVSASAAIDGDTVVFGATATAGAVASVDAQPDSVALATLGATAQLGATSYDAYGNDCGCTAAWSSRDTTVATVDGAGLVSAIGNGATYVIDDVAGVLDSVHVLVAQAADSVDVTLAAAQIAAGASTTASGAAFDASGAPIAGAAFAWSSSDTTVATVDAAGTVSGRLAGSAWIRGTHGALADSAQVTVVAGPVASVNVEPDTLSFTTFGQTQQMSATTLDAFGNDCGCTPTWFSQDPAVVTVDAAGLVTAVANGATWVVANVDGVRDSALAVVSTVGASITWLGVASSDWGNPANWSTGALPTGADTVFVPAAAAFQPLVATPDSIAGLIVETGASVTVNASPFTVVSYLLGDGTVGGTGTLRLRDAEVRHTLSEGVVQLPAFEVSGATFLWNRIVANGSVRVQPGAFLELTYGGLQALGDVQVIGDNAYLGVFDSLIVAGSLQVGGAESSGAAHLENMESIVVADSVLVTGNGFIEFGSGAFPNTMRIGGNARWESAFTVEGLMPQGIIEIAGDWHMQGPSFHSPDLQVVFNGSALQRVTHLDVGHGVGQGHFGPIHVLNPSGVQFLTPTLIRGELRSEPGVPVVADTLVVEGDIVVGADLSASAVDAMDITVSGTLTAGSVTLQRLLLAGALVADSTTYLNRSENLVSNINAGVSYATLLVQADSAAFTGPATIANDLHAHGHLRLGGRTTVGGAVRIENAGNLVLNGHTLELTGTDSLSTGLATGTGVLTMTQPADSLIAHAVFFDGGSTAGLLTDGTIATHGVWADGVALHGSNAHSVVMRAPSIGTPFFTISGASLVDGAGARFATLRMESSGFTTYTLTGGIAALRIENDSIGAPVFASAFGAPAPVRVREASLYNAAFTNTPLIVDGTSGQLSLDSLTFQGFDVALTQLDITHEGGAFSFTGMTFDSLRTPGDGTYVSVARVGFVDANLVIDIEDTNLDNGEDFTADDDATADVRWVNDVVPAPAPATIAWTGGTSADWLDASNWNTGALPTTSDVVWVYAAAPSQPQVAQPDTIAGLYLEDGAQVQLADSLVVTGSVRAGSSIVDIGAGVLHVVGTLGVDTVSGVLPSTIADGVTFTGDSTRVEGNLTIRGAQGAFAESPLHATGNVRIEETIAVSAALVVDGALEILGGRVGAGLQLQAGGTATVGDSLHVGGSGTLVMQDATNLVTVSGNARFSSDFSSDGLLTAGTMRLHGDLYAAGGALHSTGTLVELRAAVDQRVELVNSGPSPIEAQLDDFAVIKAGGIVYLESDLYVAGALTENAGYPVWDTAQAHTVRVDGVVDMAGALMVDSLQIGGAFLNVGNVLSAHTTEFFGTGQPIPGSYGFENLLVSGSATYNGGPITGDLAVTGALTLAGSMEVAGITTVAGAVTLNGYRLGTTDLDVVLGGLSLTNSGDSLVIRGGNADFRQPSSSTLSTGLVIVEQGGNLVTDGAAFRSTGSALHMYGDTLFMSDAGPGALQGALAGLWLGRPASYIVVDSVYVTQNIIDFDSVVIVDRGQIEGGSWYGEIRVENNISTPRTSYTFQKLRLAGAMDYDFGASDVDSTQFTGTNQVIPVVDALSQPLSHGTIIVTGSDVHLGWYTDSDYLDIASDVVVRGAGSKLTVHSSDNGFLGSLRIAEGDATTRVVIHDAVTVRGSTVVESGVLELGGSSLSLNGDGIQPIALQTTGTGVVEMDQATDALYASNGDVVFEGGSTNGLLTAGDIVLSSPFGDTTTFRATGAAFHATGTHARLDVDSIVIVDGGIGATQARFAGLTYGTQTGPFFTQRLVGHLVVEDSIVDYIGAGSGIAGAPGSQLTVLGQFRSTIGRYDIPRITAYQNLQGSQSSQVDVVELVGAGTQTIGDDLAMKPDTIVVNAVVTMQVDTMAFPADTLAGTVIVQSGTLFLAQGGSAVVRDSVVVDGGQFFPNTTFVTIGDPSLDDGALVTRNTGTVRMTSAAFVTVNGDVEFTGGATSGLMSAGQLSVAGDFYAENGAFQATGSHIVVLEQPASGFPTIRMATPGVGSGLDNFRDLRLATNTATNIASDLYVSGVLSDHSDAPSTSLWGTGFETIRADGWQLTNFGNILVNDVTMELDADIDPLVDAPAGIDGIRFGQYTQSQTALRVRHPGISGLGFVNLKDVDFNSSTGIGVYVHAIDSDGVSIDQLRVRMEIYNVGLPADFDVPAGNKILEENGADIYSQVTT